jgi:hypothetical protein
MITEDSPGSCPYPIWYNPLQLNHLHLFMIPSFPLPLQVSLSSVNLRHPHLSDEQVHALLNLYRTSFPQSDDHQHWHRHH